MILGVLPLIIEAAKAYRTVAEKLKIFRHYSLEVRPILYSHLESKCTSLQFLNPYLMENVYCESPGRIHY